MAGWGDIVLHAERAFWLRVIVWGALTVLVGSAVMLAAMLPRWKWGALRAFGAVLTALGLVVLVVGGWTVGSLSTPDVSGAARLERSSWFALGLTIGCAATGAAISTIGWRVGRSASVAAAGLAVLVHAAATTLLLLLLLPAVSR